MPVVYEPMLYGITTDFDKGLARYVAKHSSSRVRAICNRWVRKYRCLSDGAVKYTLLEGTYYKPQTLRLIVQQEILVPKYKEV